MLSWTESRRHTEAARRGRRRAVVLGLAAMALALLVAACGGGGSSEDAPDQADSNQDAVNQDAVVDGGGGSVMPTVRILGPSPAYDPNQNEAMKVVMEGMAELGMETEVETVPDFPAFDDVASARDYDLAFAGYVGTMLRLEPTELLGAPLSCAGVDSTNYSGYCKQEYEKLLQQANTASDADKRHSVVDQMQQMLAADLPMIVM
ncbi:MAG: hypothetical protein GEU90_21255, partial [Gemmatimonas sp.]|nr:hypothetical protein [Gemmatimonas sp.]